MRDPPNYKVVSVAQHKTIMNKYIVRQACATTVMMDTVNHKSTTTTIISAYQKQSYWEVEAFCCTMYTHVKMPRVSASFYGFVYRVHAV